MAYPVTVIAPEGEQYNDYVSTDQRWPLGSQLCFNDGRKYRFASVGGSTLVVGDLVQGAAGVAGDRVQTGVANAIGVRSPTVTATNPTAANLYAAGYLNIDTTPGGGHLYVIDNHIATTAATGAFNLAPGHAIRVALTAASTTTLVKNPYLSVIQSPITNATGPLAGVAMVATTTGRFGWVQTAGIASVLATGTVVIGDAACFTRATAAGAITSGAASTNLYIGQIVAVGVTWCTVKLNMDA